MAYFRTCHSQDLYTFMGSWQPDYRGFALFPCTGERDYQLDHVGTFFLYIYTFMVLVELDVGNIMPYVTREAPSTTSFCHDDSTVITSYLRQRSTLEKGVAGGFSELQHHCTRLQSMRLETEARCQQQVHYLTINLSLLQRTKTWEKQLGSAGLDADHFVITASSIADRVITILHPFYEAYLLKLFSHSHLLLYTEDLVVLESVSIRSRGGRFNPETDCISELPHGWLPPISLHSWSIYLASWTLFSSDSVPSHYLLCLNSARRRDALYWILL